MLAVCKITSVAADVDFVPGRNPKPRDQISQQLKQPLAGSERDILTYVHVRPGSGSLRLSRQTINHRYSQSTDYS